MHEEKEIIKPCDICMLELQFAIDLLKEGKTIKIQFFTTTNSNSKHETTHISIRKLDEMDEEREVNRLRFKCFGHKHIMEKEICNRFCDSVQQNLCYEETVDRLGA